MKMRSVVTFTDSNAYRLLISGCHCGSCGHFHSRWISQAHKEASHVS